MKGVIVGFSISGTCLVASMTIRGWLFVAGDGTSATGSTAVIRPLSASTESKGRGIDTRGASCSRSRRSLA